MNRCKKNIVIIEDDPVLRKLTQTALTLEGYHVDMFEDGAEGISYLETHLQEVDLILLDLFMPVLDGMQVLNWLRKLHQSSVKVIIMTAMNDTETESNLLSAGADIVIKKPLDMRILITSVQDVLK